MSVFTYTVVEHDPVRPWIVVGETRHLSVELEDVSDFAAWAAGRWPRDRYTADLDVGQEQPRLRY